MDNIDSVKNYNNNFRSTAISIVFKELLNIKKHSPFKSEFKLLKGYAFKSSDYNSEGINIVRVTDINSDGSIDITNCKRVYRNDELYGKYLLKNRDVLLVMIGGSLGKIGIVSNDSLPAYLNQNIWKVSPTECLDPFYISCLLNYIVNDQLELRTMSYQFISTSALNNSIVPKVSAEESDVIAAFLKRYFDFDSISCPSFISSATFERLEKIRCAYSKVLKLTDHNIERQKVLLFYLKQAILQEAIQGKLTADWRAQNPAVEPASELLKRIKAEKEKLVKEKKIKKEKPLPPITADEIPFELPEGWVWCRLDDLFDVRSGVTKGKKYVEPLLNIPYLRVANVQRGFLDLSTIKTIEVPISEKEKYLLQANDLLVTEGGDPDKVGRCSIWNNEVLDCIHQNHIFCLREVTHETLFTSFFPFAINSKFAQKYFLSTNKQTTNLASINKTILRSLPIALPPFDEQCAIYQKAEALMEKCRVLEAEITKSEAQAQMLMQAVLKEAFEPAAATESEDEETIAMVAEPAGAFGKQGEFRF